MSPLSNSGFCAELPRLSSQVSRSRLVGLSNPVNLTECVSPCQTGVLRSCRLAVLTLKQLDLPYRDLHPRSNRGFRFRRLPLDSRLEATWSTLLSALPLVKPGFAPKSPLGSYSEATRSTLPSSFLRVKTRWLPSSAQHTSAGFGGFSLNAHRSSRSLSWLECSSTSARPALTGWPSASARLGVHYAPCRGASNRPHVALVTAAEVVWERVCADEPVCRGRS